jgi:hypothetical protein
MSLPIRMQLLIETEESPDTSGAGAPWTDESGERRVNR